MLLEQPHFTSALRLCESSSPPPGTNIALTTRIVLLRPWVQSISARQTLLLLQVSSLIQRTLNLILRPAVRAGHARARTRSMPCTCCSRRLRNRDTAPCISVCSLCFVEVLLMFCMYVCPRSRASCTWLGVSGGGAVRAPQKATCLLGLCLRGCEHVQTSMVGEQGVVGQRRRRACLMLGIARLMGLRVEKWGWRVEL
ncbi:hypothetical protein BDV95DRAFT_557468 [Massariosphaeria phaeospora]|uniref:Uncharacterized protein n=1 Tax=Massariosphaeria phaeospora TaxID=100035 RepID=A0A7C8IK27_9PLEO|nr:hypothetical protein BDV95DRAFT_557468 [Massariosphaeria phaeospora]